MLKRSIINLAIQPMVCMLFVQLLLVVLLLKLIILRLRRQVEFLTAPVSKYGGVFSLLLKISLLTGVCLYKL